MIWKTTLSFLVISSRSFQNTETGKQCGQFLRGLSLLILLGVQQTFSQDLANCDIDLTGCPPGDLIETCGNIEVGDVLGNYMQWTEPDYSLDCGTENGYEYQISFDLPESQEECWSFNKVQRVGNNGGTLRLWSSDGNASGTAILTSPSFFVSQEVGGTLDILGTAGEKFRVDVYLLNPEGGKSIILDQFEVTGSNTLDTYNFTIDPANFDGSGAYSSTVFRLHFEFNPINKVGNKNLIELVSIDAGLFGAACAAEANFAVVSTHNPGDFFPVGTTTVTYTATCNGCVPVVEESCSFNVIVNPIPVTPVAAEIVQPTCGESIGSILITAEEGMEYSFEGSAFSAATLYENLEPGTYTIVGRNEDACESNPLEVTINAQPETPAAPVVAEIVQPTCDIATGSLAVNPVNGLEYSINGNEFYALGSFQGLVPGTYEVIARNEEGCVSTATEIIIDDQPATPAAPLIAEIVQPTCEVATGSFTVTTVEGMLYSIDEENFSTGGTFTDLAEGTYYITAKNEEGCLSNTTEVVIGTQPETTAAPAVDTITGTTCDLDNGSISLITSEGFTYSINGTDYASDGTFSDLAAGTYSVTAKNAAGCISDVTLVTVEEIPDTEAPVADITELPVITGECTASVSTIPTATDNCGEKLEATTSDPLIYDEQGTFTITWTFTDTEGNASTQEQQVIVDDTTAPEAIIIADAIGECEVTVTAPSTSDNCAGTIVGITEDPLTYIEQGEYVITWTFNDGKGNSTTATQNVIVNDSTAPEAISIADATGECEVTVTAPSTTDNCANEIIGTTEDPLTYNEQGEYVINWSFNDGNGNTTTATQNVIVNDVTAPVAVELETVTGNCEVNVVAPTTTDSCAGTITGTTEDPLTYSELGTHEITWIFNDNNGNTTTAKQQVVVQNTTTPLAPVLADAVAECEITVAVPTTTNACTGETIQGTTTDPLTYTQQGEYQITWTFDDGDGNRVTGVQNVIINDTTAPEAISIADAIGECEVTVTAPSTSDNCTGTIIGTTEDPLAYSEQGEYVINWTFNDRNGNSTTATQKVIVNDVTAPEAITIADATGECEVTVTTPSTSDNCAGEILGTTEDPLTYTEQGEYVITWSFNDGNGNSTTATQNVIVDDVTAPEAISIADATGECEVTVTAPSTSDNCAGTIVGTTEDPLTYTEQGEYVITWTFNDGNGNSTTATQNVIVDDATAPEAITIADATGECEVTLTAPSTSDNCAGTIVGTTEDPLTYTEQGEYVITWTFNDGNGNTTTATQNVILDDVTAPEAVTIADATGECEVTVTAPSTSDNCAGTIIGTTEDPLTYTDQGEYVITWTFDDGNGNSTTATQNVIVSDVTAPEAITIADATGECEVTVTAPSTSDNCSGTIVGTTEDPLTYTEQGEYVITWTFDDGNGNSTTATQNVIVDDIIAPEAITLADATGECEVTVTAPSTSDNCAGTIVGTTEDPLTYTEQGEYVITWIFNDANGNSTTATQNVIVDDVTAPEAITIADATGECEVTVTAPSTSDNCAGTIVGTTEDPLTYTEQGEYVITWTFNDGNGNFTTATQNVIVNDVTAPEAITIADATGECEVTITAPSTTDNCAGTIIGTTEDPLTYTEQGEYVITWTFNDGNGNVTTATQNAIVDDITAPEAITLADATGECEVTVIAPSTSDNCAGTIVGTTEDPLTYTEQGEYVITWTFNDGNGNSTTATQNVIVNDITTPEAITIADATGECEVTVTAPSTSDNCAGTIVGTTEDPLTYTEQGEYEVTWSFTDGNGNVTTATQNVIVNDNTAPEAITIADAIGECEVTVTAPTTSDNCAGTIVGTTEDPLTYTQQGEYVITWTFNDGNGNSTTATQNVIVDDVTAPEAITIADATGECEVTVTAPTTTDNCSGTIIGTTEDPLTYTEQGEYVITWTFNDGNGNSTTATQNVIVDDVTAPEAITIADATGECEVTVTAPSTSDNCAGTIVGTTEDPLTYTEQGEYVVTWTFNDGNGNSTTATQNVIVNDVTAPEAITIADATGECEVTVTAPSTSDNCAGTIVGTTENPLTYLEQGEYVITWTFNDGNGNVTTATQNVIVNDVTAPEAITIADATGECEVTVTAPSTSDNCSGTIVGTTEDPLTYTEQGEYVITWTFNDGNGNSTTATQKVIVDDITAPEAITIADATGECEVTVSAPSTSDNCAGTIVGTTEDPLTYTEQGEYMITWTFNDGNGNSTTAIQNVIVEDTSAPEWTSALPSDVTVSCNEVPEAAELTAEDGCGVNVTFSEEMISGDCASNYSIVRTWTATDNTGNATTHIQTITVEDVTAPQVVESLEEVINITCEEIPVAPELTFTDNCSSEVNVDFEETMTDGENGSFTITRTWTVTDCPGNEAVFTQTVNVAPEAGEIETTTVDLCIEDSTFDLFELLYGEYNENGTWEDTMETGALTGSFVDPALLEVGQYSFDYVIENGECSSTTSVMVSINDDCVVLPCGIDDIRSSISKAVTPNGDNQNDRFEIGLDVNCSFTYNVKIFNRWGSKVFEDNNYQNNWDGTSTGSIGGDSLPAGTYYYIIEVNQGGFEPIQSYIYLGTK